MMVWEAPFSKLCRGKPQTSARQQRFHKRGIRSLKAPRYMHNLSPFVTEKARTFQDAGYLVQSDQDSPISQKGRTRNA